MGNIGNMKKITKIAFSVMLALSLGSVSVSADAAKGQKLYTKKLKSVCEMTGAVMAGKHTQDEWDEIGVEGLSKEVKIICPKVKDKALKGKYLEHYFDFFKEYSSDSGNVPSC